MSTRLKALQREGDPILTSVVRGYSNNDFIADQIVPVVPVDKENGKVPKFGKERFLIYEAKRALRAASNEIDTEEWETMPFELDEYDLSVPLDKRETNTASASNWNIKAESAQAVMEGLMLSKEQQIADMLLKQANYPSGHVDVISSTDLWTNSASDPVSQIEDGKATIREKIGKDPNTLVLSPTFYKAALKHPGMIELIKYAQVGVLDMELLKKLFMVERIIVGNAIRITSKTSTDFKDVWGKSAILAYVNQSPKPNERQPSFAYTLQYKGFPIGDEYEHWQKKVDYVRATDIRETVIVGNDAAYLITE